MVQIPKDCELHILFNLSGKTDFMNSVNWSVVFQNMLERKSMNTLL